MSNPQQPELARSRRTPHQDQDSVAAVVEGQRHLEDDGPRGPVPPENQPGHHPPTEQDQPDLDAFAARLSGEEPSAPAPERRAGSTARIAALVTAAVVLVALVVTLKRRRGRAG
jgi:hypothetical protein